jgi:hypothetical protein
VKLDIPCLTVKREQPLKAHLDPSLFAAVSGKLNSYEMDPLPLSDPAAHAQEA